METVLTTSFTIVTIEVLDLPFCNKNGFNKMASRTLLQLLTLSIIFTNQIEARTFNKTHDLEKNQQYDIITTPVNKRSDKANANDGNNTVLMKKIYSHFDQRSDTSAESRNNILSRNKYDGKYKHKGYEETDSDKSQAEQQSEDNIKSNATITSNRIELTSSDNRKPFSNEATCSEEANQVNSINRKLVAEVMAQTVAIKKVKQEGETKTERSDESLQNYVVKDYPTVKPVRLQKQLTVKPRYSKSRTTQATREKQIIPKITHKQHGEAENEICKMKHCDYKNHRSFEKISRDHDVYKLKRRDEFKTASKRKNKKTNNMKIKHRHNKSHRAFKTKPQENAQYKLKHRDVEKRVLSNTISVENDIYVRKHINDFATVDETVTDNYLRKHIDDSATVEEPVSKQVNPKYKPKYSNHMQKKRQVDKKDRKVRNTDKTKHYSKTKTRKPNLEKVISNQEKYKPALNEDRDSDIETHTNIRKGDNERNANSGDTLNLNDADTPTKENHDENETLESYEELLKQNDFLNKPKLPFYVSSTTKRIKKEIFTMQPKKLLAWKSEKETDILLDDLNAVLKGNSDSINQNIDFNTTISRLASSKILDFLTDRLAGQMLKKLEKSLASKNHFKTKEDNPEKVEQIDILFKKDGDMVMMGREHVNEKEDDENGFKEAFYP